MAKKYSEYEIEYMRNHYKTETCKEMAAHLGRDANALSKKLNKLGLYRTDAERNAIINRVMGKYQRKKGDKFTLEEKQKISKGLRRTWFKQAKKAASGELVGYYKMERLNN